MSSDEQALEIGHLVRDFQQAKQELAALNGKGRRIGGMLEVMGQGLGFACPPMDRFQQEYLNVLNPDEILKLARETNSAFERVKELRDRLTALGLTPREN